ncbi:MAG: signal peptidase I [Syntrophothermus sp.]
MSALVHSPLARRARLFGTWLFIGVLFAALLTAAAPLALGDRSFTMRSGSMTPAIETGDVVVTEPISPLSAEVGDIVTFVDPEGTGKLFSHRVQSIRAAGDVVHFVTRGDANTSVERWSVPADGSVGKVLYRVPKLGYAIVWAGTPEGRIGLIVVPALLLCWTAMARIWRPRGEPDGGAAAHE